MAEIVGLAILFAGGIAAVWKTLSNRIGALESQVELLMQQNIAVLKENSSLQAERDLHSERRADLAQQVQVLRLQRDRLWAWLERALDMRVQLEELRNIRAQADEFFEPEDAPSSKE